MGKQDMTSGALAKFMVNISLILNIFLSNFILLLPTLILISPTISFASDQRSEIPMFQAQPAYSIDAIAVWEYNNTVYYSFYGHTPAIPKPVGNITGWRWWSLSPNYPSAPLASGNMPNIAFSREGWAMAIWGEKVQTGTCITPDGVPIPIYRGDIKFSIFNVTRRNWSTPALVASPQTGDNIYLDPALAFDENGTGIAIWAHEYIKRHPDCTEEIIAASIHMSFWDGGAWIGDTVIYSKSQPSGSLPLPDYLGPEIAFTSTKATVGTPKTPNQAVAVWWSYIKTETLFCGDNNYKDIAIFWPMYGIWDGSSFSSIGELPGRPAGPPYSLFSSGKIGLSPDKKGRVLVTWPLAIDHNPCDFIPAEGEVWFALWNGTAGWEKSEQFDKNVPTFLSTDVAFNPNDVAISLYRKDNMVFWSTYNGTWSNLGQLDNAFSGHPHPSLASLHHNHNITIAVWEALNGEIHWSTFNYTKKDNIIWSPAQTLGKGGKPEIAAHTGSPTLPLAEWTYASYLAADNDLHDAIIGGDRSEMLRVGSTSLVNVVNLADPNNTARPFGDANVRYEYIKRNSFIELRNLGELDTSNPNTLEDFITWVVETYPANRFILDIADHGLGWREHCQDLTAGNRWMNMIELKQALANTGKKFNIIVFSECLMAQLEVAYQIMNFANYMVASEEVMPGPGPDYVRILTNLTNNPFQSDRTFAINMVDFFRQVYSDRSGNETLSAIDLSLIPNVANSVNNFANALIKKFTPNNIEIWNARDRSESFNETTYKDLIHFASLINTLVTDNTIRNAAQAVINSASRAMIANWAEVGHPNAYGMSIYIEPSIIFWNLLSPGYNALDFARDTDWDLFIGIQAASSGILLKLKASPLLIFETKDDEGNSAIKNDFLPTDMRCVFCVSKGTVCNSFEDETFIVHPLVSHIIWTINATYLKEENTTYYLTIQVIVENNVIYEESYSGVIKRNTTYSQLFVAPSPDLIVSNVSFSNWNPLVNETVQMNISVKNIGTFPVYQKNLTLKVWANGTLFDGIERLVNFTAGEEKLVLSRNKTFDIPGKYNITVMVDWDNRIKELNETNNVKTVFINVVSQAKFKITDLTISSKEIQPGEKVTISVKVTNIGGTTGSYTVELKVNGVTVDSKTVTLAGGQSTTVVFEWSAKDAGNYEIDVAGLKVTVKVTAPTSPVTAPTPLIPLYLIVAIIIASVLISIWIIARRKKWFSRSKR
jgi:hypothetical protein